MKVAGKQILDLIKDKETLNTKIHQFVSDIEEYFQKYDTIQLLGSFGLYLLDNLPKRKTLYAHLYGVDIQLDEKAEIMVEYAMNIQDEISALEAEKAAADARIAKANAQIAAANQRASEKSARASKAEAEILKLLSSPNFPEDKKQQILSKLRAFGSKV